MLGSYRVLELPGEISCLCGRVLADLGADVIKIEPPSGDPSRRLGPFWHGIPHPEKSLYWFAYNANKRGITLDIETEDGQALFRHLTRNAAVVIDCFRPGRLDELGLSYAALSNENPSLVHISITPFGETGPYRDYKASDMVLTAMGGLLYITGYRDRTPVRISFPQANLLASAEAAVATLIALFYRDLSRQGQHIDFSMQQSQIISSLNVAPFSELTRTNIHRAGIFRTAIRGHVNYKYLWECKDGFVIYHVYGSAVGARSNRNLVKWMDSEGATDDYLKAVNWEGLDMATIDQERQEAIEEHMARFLRTRTQAELVKAALTWDIMLGPVASVEDVFNNSQLKDRQFWQDVSYPELDDTIAHPGIPFKSSRTGFKIDRRAPLIGEHNQDIYCGEMGISKEQLVNLKQGGVI